MSDLQPQLAGSDSGSGVVGDSSWIANYQYQLDQSIDCLPAGGFSASASTTLFAFAADQGVASVDAQSGNRLELTFHLNTDESYVGLDHRSGQLPGSTARQPGVVYTRHARNGGRRQGASFDMSTARALLLIAGAVPRARRGRNDDQGPYVLTGITTDLASVMLEQSAGSDIWTPLAEPGTGAFQYSLRLPTGQYRFAAVSGGYHDASQGAGSSWSAQLMAVPEPGSLLLLATAMGIGRVAGRRQMWNE
ncbi:MAG: PEP-CTERM sorting domain-containing protein [Candidatus Accumulibacter sp. UW20]